ncbi:MAG: IS630 family transposase [Lachnospiraceae bacterium]|nr:IS630 family transposase [Lachnospiraceae bacterium]
MTCQRPTKKVYFQDNVKLNTFMHETYPGIVEKARKENAEIYWGDETSINNQAYYIKGYSPKGKTPEIASFNKTEKINMVSAITNHGTCRFTCYEENMTQQLFIDFMKRLVKDADRKVLFIVGNLRVHHGKMVNEWMDSHKDEIEIFFMSPHSPEINPDEYLNHNLKQNVHSGIIPHTKEQIQKKTEAYMHGLQEHKERVTSLFKHKKLNYIKIYSC